MHLLHLWYCRQSSDYGCTLDTGKKTPRKARILKDGVLTLATWGADESLTWLKRIGEFQCAVR